MDSIRNVLETIKRCLESYLQNLDRRADDWVALTSIVDHDGALNPNVRDKVVMCLFNVTRETTISSFQAAQPAAAGVPASAGMAVVSPPLYIDLHLLFMANFPEQTYPDGLSALSRVIGFFQQNATLTPDTAPGLSPDIPRITLDFENLGPVDVNYVMGMLGTRYYPSAFYKMRMLTFASPAMQGRSFPVAGAGVDGQRQRGISA
jgi:hypothetical protein